MPVWLGCLAIRPRAVARAIAGCSEFAARSIRARLRPRLAGATCGDRFAIVIRQRRFAVLLEPLGERVRRPPRVLVLVALIAGIRCAQLDRQIRARDPQTVVTARIDHHVVFLRHVALDALRSGRSNLVVMVRGRIVFGRDVALRAEQVCQAHVA